MSTATVFTPMMGVVTETMRTYRPADYRQRVRTVPGNENEHAPGARDSFAAARMRTETTLSCRVACPRRQTGPQKGKGQGNNYSGSTQWHNSVRSRLALVESDRAGIELLHEKANYGLKRTNQWPW